MWRLVVVVDCGSIVVVVEVEALSVEGSVEVVKDVEVEVLLEVEERKVEVEARDWWRWRGWR